MSGRIAFGGSFAGILIGIIYGRLKSLFGRMLKILACIGVVLWFGLLLVPAFG